MNRYGPILWTILSVIGLDQITKYLVLENIQRGDVIVIIPNFFNLILTYNLGAAFGMFSDLPEGLRHALLAISITIALGTVLYFFLRDYKDDKIAQIALAMIIGGAFGNIIDRFQHGMVVDFLDLYIGTNHWPAFNVADSAICIGVVILFFRRPQKTLNGDAA